MTDGTGTSNWTYDSLHRRTSVTDGSSAKVGYRYDLANDLIGITYPAAGGATPAVTRSYDGAGRLTRVVDGLGHTFSFAYDRNDNLVTSTLPQTSGAQAMQDVFNYDRADRLTSIRDLKAGALYASFTDVRDAAGLLTSEGSTGVSTPTQTYAYDSLDQLKILNGASYGYDAANDLTTTPAGTLLSYDAASQLISETAGGSTTTFSFDARGNRTATTPASGPATALTYDQANRLIGYSSGSATATYGYDGAGLRMTKTVNGSSERFVWDRAGSLPLLLEDGSTSLVEGPGGLPLEQVAADGTTLFYHHDQLGSTRILTDAAGAVQRTISYDPYGTVRSSTGTATPLLGYAGGETDAESGFLYLRERYFDPATGQFVSRDPLVGVTGQPYSYAGNSPTNATDPAGLDTLMSQIGCDIAAICVTRGGVNEQGGDVGVIGSTKGGVNEQSGDVALISATKGGTNEQGGDVALICTTKGGVNEQGAPGISASGSAGTQPASADLVAGIVTSQANMLDPAALSPLALQLYLGKQDQLMQDLSRLVQSGTQTSQAAIQYMH